MQYLKPRSVMDVGCGTGTWLKVFQELGADVKGIDSEYVDRRKFMAGETLFFDEFGRTPRISAKN